MLNFELFLESVKKMSAKKKIYVDTSTIPNSGKGLFTSINIKKGNIIEEFKGKIINNEECSRISSSKGDRGYYLIDMGKDKTMDVYHSKSLVRYANDAEGFKRMKGFRNNSKLLIKGDRVYCVATKDIKSGSEIFMGYGKAYWEAFKVNHGLNEDLKGMLYAGIFLLGSCQNVDIKDVKGNKIPKITNKEVKGIVKHERTIPGSNGGEYYQSIDITGNDGNTYNYKIYQTILNSKTWKIDNGDSVKMDFDKDGNSKVYKLK